MATVILLATTAFAQTYCGMVDDGSIHVPSNYLTFTPPAVGSSYTDPDFINSTSGVGCTITTLTNAVSAGHAWHHQHTNQEPFNADDSLIFILDDSGGWYIIAGPVTNSNNNNQSLATLVVNSSNMPSWNVNGPIWDLTNPLVFYSTTSNRVYKATVNPSAGTVSTATIATLSSYTFVCMSGQTFASDLDNSGTYFGIMAQNGGSYCGDGSVDVYMMIFDVSTGTVGGATNLGMGTTEPHGWLTLPDGNIVVDPNSGTYSGGNVIWNGTTSYTYQTVADHTDFGYKGTTEVGVMQREADSGQTDPCPNGEGVSYAQALYSYPSLDLACLYNQWESAGAEAEISFRDEVGGQPWVFVSMFDSGRVPGPEWFTHDTANWAGSTWANYWGTLSTGSTIYEGEIDAVNINTGQVLRLAHSRSRSAENYWAIPRATPSHDGKYILFDSNMLVANTNPVTNIADYGDVYMITFDPSSAPSPPTGLTAAVK